MNIKQILFLAIFTLLLIIADSPGGDGWKAPEFAKAIDNPLIKLQGAPKMILMGKGLYDANCATCHGDTGRGDGSSGRFLTKRPTDLSSDSSQTDGELFWKIQIGKSPMPAFSETLSAKKIWLIVNYIRTLRR